MQERVESNIIDSFPQHNPLKSSRSPIGSLRNSFQKSLANASNQKIPKEIEDIITVDLTPVHVTGDFTFPVFEIAKVLKIDYSTLASDIAKNLKSYKKYISGIEIVNGYINVTIKPKTFYPDSLRYILSKQLLQDSSKKIKTVLLVSGYEKINDPVNRPVSQFIHRLYASHPYIVKEFSIDEHTPTHKARSLLRKAIKMGTVKNFGNNVVAIHLSQEKYALLQRQDKTPTPLLYQLSSLATHAKENNPTILIFSLNIAPQSVREFLATAQKLQILKDTTRILIINDSIMENKINLYHLNTLKNLQKEAGLILKHKPLIDSSEAILLQNTEMAVARLLSYAPEVFRRTLFQASPQAIIKYTESCESPVREMHQSMSPLLLHAVHKVFDTSLRLITN